MAEHPKRKGEKTEAIILAEFIKRDFVVLLPFGDNQRYDMVIDDHSGFKRVQCKTGKYTESGITFSTCSSRINTKRKYKTNYRGQADYFAVFCYERNEVYLIPVDAVGTTKCTLRFYPTKNRVKKGILMSESFLLP